MNQPRDTEILEALLVLMQEAVDLLETIATNTTPA